MYRKAYAELKKWKASTPNSKAILIKGARRVGKSYLAEEFAKNEYKSHILIDFSSPLPGTEKIFSDYGNKNSLDALFNHLSVLYSTKLYERETVFVFDEVQRYPQARELIKHLVADRRYDYIETGSLISIKQNVKDIIIPSEEQELILHPMDFEEYLLAGKDETTTPCLKDHYESRTPLGTLFRTIMEKFRMYMLVGGMPQAVLAYVDSKSLDVVEAAKSAIIKLYREDIAKYAAGCVAEAQSIFDAMPSQLSHHDKKIKFSALGVRSRYAGYTDALHWICESMVGSFCYGLDEPTVLDGFSLQPDKIKCYMADTGLLLTMAAGQDYLTSELYKSFVLGRLSANKGMLTENIVAQMLTAAGHPLRFYEKIERDSSDRKKKYEVDFIIKSSGRPTAIEVKSSNAQEHASLDYFTKKYQKSTGKPIVLTKGDLRETEDYLYLPLPMAGMVR